MAEWPCADVGRYHGYIPAAAAQAEAADGFVSIISMQDNLTLQFFMQLETKSYKLSSSNQFIFGNLGLTLNVFDHHVKSEILVIDFYPVMI